MLSSRNHGNRQKLVGWIQPDCFQFLQRQRAPFHPGLALTALVLQLALVKVMFTADNISTVILGLAVHLTSEKLVSLEF